MILSAVAALRYELAVPLPETDEDARTLVTLGLLTTVLTTSLLTVVFGLALALWDGELSNPVLTRWMIWVPLLAGVIAVFQLLNQWALRQHRYNATARRNVIASVSTVLVQLALGWRFPGPSGLVVGLGVGQTLGAATLLRGAHLHLRSTRAQIAHVARRYRRFPLLLAPSGLLNMAGVYLPLLLVASQYGAEAAGWLGFTQRVLALPMMLVGQAVAQVYLSELASTHRSRGDHHVRLFRTASQRLAIIAAVSAVALVTLAPSLFPAVFGRSWTMSGSMAQALAVGLAAQLVAAPLSQTLIVFERQGLQLSWDLGRLILVSAAVLVPAAAGLDVLECVWILSGASTFAYAVAWTLSRWVIMNHHIHQSLKNGTE